MTSARKQQIRTLLKGIETGDPESVAVVNEAKYIQHNPMTREGSEGLAELFKRLSQTSPRVSIVRMLADGDYVVAHTEYDFDDVVVGFEVFRFEDGLAVEHWDNLQRKHGAPNASGHTMNDGPTEVTDLDKTDVNRELVRSFVDDILIGRRLDKLDDYVGDAAGYTEHNPQLSDGVQALRSALSEVASNGEPVIVYSRMHRLIAEGNMQLCVCEGFRDGVHTAFYDLFRVEDLKVVEHWDTTDAIPPRSEWRNDNGKF